MIKGKTIGLTAVLEEDMPLLMHWRNQEDMRCFYREYREINEAMQRKWYNERVINDPNTLMFSIRKLNDGTLIGSCGLCYINWIQRNAEISLYIGDNDAYLDERAEESLELLLVYGFGQIGMHKLWSECFSFDERRIAIMQKYGFQLDGILREHHFHQGRWHDSHIYSLLSDEY